MRPIFPLGIGVRPFAAIDRPRPLRLAYFEACQDLEDDLFCPLVAPDVLMVGGWGRRRNYELLSRQIERRRISGRP